MSLKVDWCTFPAARYACERWHYSRSVPVPPRVCFGVWESGEFVGTVIFSRGIGPLHRPYGIEQSEVCELTRIAMRAHRAPVSQIVSICLRMLRRANPKLRLIVSFADPNEGHHGGVYQAGNWLYSGTSGVSREFRDSSGNRLHSRQVSRAGTNRQFGGVRAVPRPDMLTKLRLPGKHRYLMPLDAEMRTRLKPFSKPYPKRPKQAIAGDHPDSGGATPTRTLQPDTTLSACAAENLNPPG